MNNSELGKLVKQKYPQYASLSDEEVGSKVVSKYPQYSPPPEKKEVKQKKSLLDKLADPALFDPLMKATGVDALSKDIIKSGQRGLKLADLIGRSIPSPGQSQQQAFDPQQYEALPDWAKSLRYSPEEIQTKFGGETGGERFGQGFSEGSRTAAGIGKYLVTPGGGKGSVNTIAPQSFLSKLAGKSAYGAGISGAASYGRDESLGQVASDAAIGGAVSGALFTGSEVVKQTGNILNKVGGGIYRSALDQSKKAVENEIRTGQYLADEAMNRKVMGTSTGIINQAKSGKQAAWGSIETITKGSKENFDLKGMADDTLNPMIEELKAAGDDASAKAVEKIKDSLIKNNGEVVDAGKILFIRKALDSQVKNTFGKEISTINSSEILARRLLGNKIRDRVSTQIPDLSAPLNDYHFWSRMEQAMISKKAGGDFFVGAGGSVPKNVQGIFSTIMKPFRDPSILTPIGLGVSSLGTGVRGIGKAGQTPAAQYGITNLTQLLQGRK